MILEAFESKAVYFFFPKAKWILDQPLFQVIEVASEHIFGCVKVSGFFPPQSTNEKDSFCEKYFLKCLGELFQREEVSMGQGCSAGRRKDWQQGHPLQNFP